MTGLGTASFTPIAEDEKTEIHNVCYPYYLKLIEYCEAQGIQVLSVYIPFAAEEEQQRIANTVGDTVEEYANCHYVNMLPENILDYNTDVCPDNSHLNYSGALKVTEWLGRYLSEHYQLDDYRSCDSWKEDYKAYFDYKVAALQSQTTLPAYLVQLTDKDFYAEVEIYDSDLLKSERLRLLYENADIEPVFVDCDNGHCAKIVVYSSQSHEIIDTADFICDEIKNLNVFSIRKESSSL